MSQFRNQACGNIKETSKPDVTGGSDTGGGASRPPINPKTTEPRPAETKPRPDTSKPGFKTSNPDLRRNSKEVPHTEEPKVSLFNRAVVFKMLCFWWSFFLEILNLETSSLERKPRSRDLQRRSPDPIPRSPGSRPRRPTSAGAQLHNFEIRFP